MSQLSVGVFFPQPVDYQTNHAEASISMPTGNGQWSASYRFSVFRDALTSVTVQNPITARLCHRGGRRARRLSVSFGQFSLPPDKRRPSIHGERRYAVSPRHARHRPFAYTIQTQNDAFLPLPRIRCC